MLKPTLAGKQKGSQFLRPLFNLISNSNQPGTPVGKFLFFQQIH